MTMTDIQAESAAIPRVGRSRGPYAKSAETRTTILDAALEVFAESGYRAGSLRDVATRVGMSEAGVLHHFPTKSALLAAVLERRDERSFEFLPDLNDGAGSARGIVRLIAYNQTQPGIVKLYATVSAEATTPTHPAHGYFLSRYVTTRAMMRQIMVALEVEGLLHEGVDPDEAAIDTLAFMDGLQIQWLLDPSVLDMARALRRYFRSFTDVDFDQDTGAPES